MLIYYKDDIKSVEFKPDEYIILEYINKYKPQSMFRKFHADIIGKYYINKMIEYAKFGNHLKTYIRLRPEIHKNAEIYYESAYKTQEF